MVPSIVLIGGVSAEKDAQHALGALTFPQKTQIAFAKASCPLPYPLHGLVGAFGSAIVPQHHNKSRAEGGLSIGHFEGVGMGTSFSLCTALDRRACQ